MQHQVGSFSDQNSCKTVPYTKCGVCVDSVESVMCVNSAVYVEHSGVLSVGSGWVWTVWCTIRTKLNWAFLFLVFRSRISWSAWISF